MFRIILYPSLHLRLSISYSLFSLSFSLDYFFLNQFLSFPISSILSPSRLFPHFYWKKEELTTNFYPWFSIKKQQRVIKNVGKKYAREKDRNVREKKVKMWERKIARRRWEKRWGKENGRDRNGYKERRNLPKIFEQKRREGNGEKMNNKSDYSYGLVTVNFFWFHSFF